VAAHEALEHAVAVSLRQARALVLDAYDGVGAVREHRDGDRAVAVDAGVVDQDPEDALDGGAVGKPVDGRRRDDLDGELGAEPVGELAELHRLQRGVHAAVDAAEVEEVGGERHQAVRLA